MAFNASNFVGDVPRHYDECLGPNIFDFYARDMAARVAAKEPQDLLEIAAGSGIVTRKIRDALPLSAALTATDLNDAMLEVARKKFGDTDNVTFTSADALDLPFEDNSFDVLFCQFGHMFFPDRAKAHAEAMRVVRPGGAYVFSTWSDMERNPFARIAYETLSEAFSGNPPGFYKVPFSLHDPDAILAELKAAGMSDTSHIDVDHERVVPDFQQFAKGLVFGNPSIQEIHERGGNPDEIQTEIAKRFRFYFGEEPAGMPLLAHVFEVTIH